MRSLQKYTIVSAKIQVPTVLMPRDTKTIICSNWTILLKVLGKQFYEGLCVADKLLVFAFFSSQRVSFFGAVKGINFNLSHP